MLKTSRSMVMLEPGEVAVDGASAGQDFLEGIGSLDSKFDAWVRDMRARRTNNGAVDTIPGETGRKPVTAPQQVVILLQTTLPDQGSNQNILLFMREFIGRSLSELHHLAVIHTDSTNKSFLPQVPTLVVDIRTFDMGQGMLSLKATIEEFATLRTFWSRLSNPISNDTFYDDITGCLSFSQSIIQSVWNIVATEPLVLLPSEQHVASVLAATAMRRMFSMRKSEIEAASDFLDRAISIHPRGLYHAWRAQLALIQKTERQGGDLDAIRDRARYDIAIALEKEPQNSNVLAFAARVQGVLEQDHELSLLLARQSIAVNHANPIGWFALSNAFMYLQQHDEAYDAALRAQGLASQTWLKHMTDIQVSLTAAVLGRTDEALANGMSAHALAPHFRPPLRYLIALHARNGSIEKSARSAKKLTELEPDFSIRRLIEDRNYPASLLHSANLIDRSSLEQVEVE
ncbi:MAG: hypothetical protein ACRCWF_09385 [Beijerinckiaceae bacterium]